MKKPSALASIIFFALCITGVVGCFLWIYPEETAAAVRVGPFSHPGVIIFCLVLVIVILVAGWFAQMLTEAAGEKGGNQNEEEEGSAGSASQPEAPPHTDEDTTRFTSGPLTDHLRLRYGRRWKSKVRLLLVQGTDDHIEKVVPGLKRDHWQENNGIVLIHAGLAKATPEPDFVDVLNEVRPQRPVDGIVQVMDCAQLPDAAALDTLVRSRQKGDSLFGWQAPVWLWFIREEAWSQEGEGVPATGSLFGPGAAPEAAVESLTTLSSRLRDAGMPVLPPVYAVDEAHLFDCDVFIFCASKGVPPVGAGGDVRMAQLEANRSLVAHYAALARQAGFGGQVCIVSEDRKSTRLNSSHT